MAENTEEAMKDLTDALRDVNKSFKKGGSDGLFGTPFMADSSFVKAMNGLTSALGINTNVMGQLKDAYFTNMEALRQGEEALGGLGISFKEMKAELAKLDRIPELLSTQEQNIEFYIAQIKAGFNELSPEMFKLATMMDNAGQRSAATFKAFGTLQGILRLSSDQTEELIKTNGLLGQTFAVSQDTLANSINQLSNNIVVKERMGLGADQLGAITQMTAMLGERGNELLKPFLDIAFTASTDAAQKRVITGMQPFLDEFTKTGDIKSLEAAMRQFASFGEQMAPEGMDTMALSVLISNNQLALNEALTTIKALQALDETRQFQDVTSDETTQFQDGPSFYELQRITRQYGQLELDQVFTREQANQFMTDLGTRGTAGFMRDFTNMFKVSSENLIESRRSLGVDEEGMSVFGPTAQATGTGFDRTMVNTLFKEVMDTFDKNARHAEERTELMKKSVEVQEQIRDSYKTGRTLFDFMSGLNTGRNYK